MSSGSGTASSNSSGGGEELQQPTSPPSQFAFSLADVGYEEAAEFSLGAQH